MGSAPILRTMRFRRAAGFETAKLLPCSDSSDALETCGSDAPLAVGQDWLLLARKLSAAAMRPSSGSPSGWLKSSATEQPGTTVPTADAVLAGEKPSV